MIYINNNIRKKNRVDTCLTYIHTYIHTHMHRYSSQTYAHFVFVMAIWDVLKTMCIRRRLQADTYACYIYMYIYIHICMYIFIYTYIHIYVCLYHRCQTPSNLCKCKKIESAQNDQNHILLQI